MTTLDQLTRPATGLVRAAVRPTTYTGHLRELSSVAVTATMWPFGFAGASLPPADDRRDTVASPVLLLHGYGANKSNWLYVNHQLRQGGFRRLHAFNYNPLSGDIRELAARCVAEAEALRAHLGAERIHLVGHSLGGLIARYAVQVLGLRDVGVCATVASPHHGLAPARLSSLVGGFGPSRSVHDLRPGSEVMGQLRTSVPPSRTRFVAYYSNLDLVVPASRARITDDVVPAENVLVKDHGHLSIMLSRRLCGSLVEQLTQSEAVHDSMAGPIVGRVGSSPPMGSSTNRDGVPSGDRADA